MQRLGAAALVPPGPGVLRKGRQPRPLVTENQSHPGCARGWLLHRRLGPRIVGGAAVAV